jgi:hypothetical protein
VYARYIVLLVFEGHPSPSTFPKALTQAMKEHLPFLDTFSLYMRS